jgi:4'-phosphopantetheinyl transferase
VGALTAAPGTADRRTSATVMHWDSSSTDGRLSMDEIRVWRVWLDDAHDTRVLWDVLAPDERERGSRFRFQDDRRRFVVSHGTLRLVLAHHMDVEPARIEFSAGPHGKPVISMPVTDLSFNLSHAHEMALIAVSRGRQLGVDVERLRSVAEDEIIAERFFSPREASVFRSLPASLRQEAFFACWTRKEAYLKATGKGLSSGFDRFDVSVAPGDPAALLDVRDEPAEAARWQLVDLRPDKGYVGALVAERGEWRVRLREWRAIGAGGVVE